MKTAAILSSLLLLSACGGQSPAENTADRLDQAAEQSDPAAAEVLANAADTIRDEGDTSGAAQEALRQAGNAQAATVGTQQPSGTAGAGAKPHAPGEPVPPPQTGSAPQQGAQNGQ